MSERPGFIGPGIMGLQMARNLLRSGYALTVFNRSQTAVDEILKEGATPTYSARGRAEQHRDYHGAGFA